MLNMRLRSIVANSILGEKIREILWNREVRKIQKIQRTKDESIEKINIIDIGCRGGFAKKFLKHDNFGIFNIYGFDPDVEECARLQEYYSCVPDGVVTCVPKALACKEGSRPLYVTKNPNCSSFYRPIEYLAENYPALNGIKVEKVISIDVTTLDLWAKENNINDVSYIKIDTQGSELEILKGGETILKSVRCIDIEVEFNSIYEEQPLFFDVDKYLRSLGFQLWRILNVNHYAIGSRKNTGETEKYNHSIDKNGQIFWADAQYVHTDVLMRPEKKDFFLFESLKMNSVVEHIKKYKKIGV